MSTSDVRWFERHRIPPTATGSQTMKVLRPRPGASVFGVAVNQELLGVFTHWIPELGGKVRCRQMWEEECPWCPDPERKWYGYIPAFHFGSGRVAVLEVSYGAAQGCPQFSTRCIPLRGMRVEVGRHDSGPFGRCWAKVEEYVRPIVLPPAADAVQFADMVFRPTESGIPSKKIRKKGGGA